MPLFDVRIGPKVSDSLTQSTQADRSCMCMCSAEIVAGSVDGIVRCFDVRMGLEVSDSLTDPHMLTDCHMLTDSTHADMSYTCTCSAEIVAGSVDGTVRRFDVRMGLEVSDSVGAAVTSVSVSGDGLCLLASCMDGAARLLDKSGGDLLASYSGAPPFKLTTVAIR